MQRDLPYCYCDLASAGSDRRQVAKLGKIAVGAILLRHVKTEGEQ